MRIKNQPRLVFDVPKTAEITETEQDIFMGNIEIQTELNGDAIVQIKENVATLQEEMNKLALAVKENDLNSSSWIERRFNLLKTIPDITEQNTKRDGSVRALENQIKMLSGRVNSLLIENKGYGEKIEKLEGDLRAKDNRITSLREDIAIIEGENSAI